MSGNDSGTGSPWGRPSGEQADDARAGEAAGRGTHDEQWVAPPPQDSSPATAAWEQRGEQGRNDAPAPWGQQADERPATQGPVWGATNEPARDHETQAPAWGATNDPTPDHQAQAPTWGASNEPAHDHQTQAPAWGATSEPATEQGGATDATTALGQAPFGQAPHGQAYDQSSPGHAPYGQSSPDHAPYDQSAHATASAPAPAAGAAHPAGPVTAAPPAGRRPWHKRPALLIAAIGGVVLLLLAAIGIPLAIHLNNVAKGDRLADEFNAALEAHNSAWTDAEINKVGDVVVSEALQENTDFYAQNAAAMSDLQARCANVETAATTLTTLLASPVPTLTVEDGADASAKYQVAKATSDGLDGRRAAVESLTTDGAAAMSALSDFCGVYPEYNSILNQLGLDFQGVFQPTLTVSNGSRIEFGNNLYMTCSNTNGCPNFADQAARTAYGDAIDATFTKFYTDMAAKSADRCFLPELQTVCDTMASEYQATADAYHLSAESIRTEQPNLSVGSLPFPNFLTQFPAAGERADAADAAIDAAWQAADPSTAGDTAPGWQARSVKVALAQHEATVTDAVAKLG